MSIKAVRSAFMAAGKGVLRRTHAGLAYRDNHEVLTFAGRHADGDEPGLPLGRLELRQRSPIPTP